MRALTVALAGIAALGGTVNAGAGVFGRYLNGTHAANISTSTVYVNGGNCGAITSTIYTTLPVIQSTSVPASELPIVISSGTGTTKTTSTQYTTVEVVSLPVTTTLHSKATLTSYVTASSGEPTTTSTETTTTTSTTTVFGTTYKTVMTTVGTGTTSTENSGVTTSESPAGSAPITASYVVTEYITTTSGVPVIQSASVTTYVSTEYITSSVAPRVQSGTYTTYVTTDYLTTAYVYTHSLPTPTHATPTGSVVVVVSKVTVEPEHSGHVTKSKSSTSPILETHTLTISSLRTVTETLVPASTTILPPVTVTSLHNITETVAPLNTTSVVPITLTSLKTITTVSVPTYSPKAVSTPAPFVNSTEVSSLSVPTVLSSVASNTTLAVSITSSSAGALNSTRTVVPFSTAGSAVPMTTSTVYSTTSYTVSKCAASVTSCPYGSLTTDTISLYVTVCPVANATQSSSASGYFNTSQTASQTTAAFPTATGGSTSSGYLSSSSSIAWNEGPWNTSSYSSSVSSSSVSAVTSLGIFGNTVVSAQTSGFAASAGFHHNSFTPYPSYPSRTSLTLASPTGVVPKNPFGLSDLSIVKVSTMSYVYNSTSSSLPSSAPVESLASSAVIVVSSSAAFNSSATSVGASSTADPVVSSLANSSSTMTTLSVVTSAAESSTSTTTSLPRQFTTPSLTATATPSTTSTSSATMTSSGPMTSSTCGEHGNFTLNFDDIPPLSVAKNATNSSIEAEPVFSPYHQFYFSEGFVAVPLPADPYLPASGNHLIEYEAENPATPALPVPGGTLVPGVTGGIGVGYTSMLGCFNFNAYGASLGCDSQGPPCVFQVSGMRYNPDIHAEEVVTSQMIPVPACPALTNCTLVPVDFDNTFVNITTIYVNATVADVPKAWYLDDLRLGWTDNGCDSGLCRQANI